MSRVSTKKPPLLGRGVYTIPEVARYTLLHPQRVRSWFCGGSGGQPPRLTHPEFAPRNGSYVVSFLDLIEVLVAGELRKQGLSMQTVRCVHEALKGVLQTDRPFCHGGLYTGGKRVLVEIADCLENTTLSETLARQQFLRDVILPHLRRIEYGRESRLAVRWRIAQGVVIDPQVSLGKPVVDSMGTTTFVLANCYLANNRDADLVADLFDVNTSDVMNAVAFEDRYGCRRAA